MSGPPRRSSASRITVWNDDEIRALIEASEHLARQPEARYDYSPILRLGVYTGLRLGELLGLQWSDINFEKKEFHVERQWTRDGEFAPPKTEAAQRRVPLSDDLVAFLRKHHKETLASGKASTLVFPSRAGTPLTHRNVQRRAFEPAAKLAGIEGVSVHSMRHAFASRMISRGVSSIVLARLMGHESSTITERRYVHLFDAVRTDDAVRIAMADGDHASSKRTSRPAWSGSIGCTAIWTCQATCQARRRLPKEPPLAQPCHGARRARTADLLGAIQALSQLSYSPVLTGL